MEAAISEEKIQVLYSKEEIDRRIQEVADRISGDYKGSSNLVVVGILKGAALFTSDLIRKLKVPCQLEFIRLASYDGSESSGNVKVYDMSLPSMPDKDILIAEDIVDSGRTAQFLLNFFKNQMQVKSIRLAALLDKPCKRLNEYKYIQPDYCCFTVDDKFVLGYGLDYEQKFRHLPFLGYIEGIS